VSKGTASQIDDGARRYIYNIAVRGNFDDCHRMVKADLGDQSSSGWQKPQLAA